MVGKHVTAVYTVDAADPQVAGVAIARGQSVGHPTIRARHESAALLRRVGATVEYRAKEQHLVVRWPSGNFGRRDGLNHLLSVLLGGQCDVGSIRGCHLVDLDLGPVAHRYPGPRYGLSGIRTRLEAHGRPLLGAVIKPKLGLTPNEMARVCHELAEAGIDFIKEDEVLGNPAWCPLERRVPAVAEALYRKNTLYAPCITGDGGEALRKARRAKQLGATAIHLNLWCGLGTYAEVRAKVELPLFFQKSGDRVWTTGPYHMDSTILYQLVRLAGCDFGHIGMFGGYLSEPVSVLRTRIRAFAPAIPSFSCGMTPEAAQKILDRFGSDVMLTAGGWLHGHPQGLTVAVCALRGLRPAARAGATT